MKGLEHVIIYELAFLPYQNTEEKKLATLTRPMHYSGVFIDLRGLVRSGKFLQTNLCFFSMHFSGC